MNNKKFSEKDVINMNEKVYLVWRDEKDNPYKTLHTTLDDLYGKIGFLPPGHSVHIVKKYESEGNTK